MFRHIVETEKLEGPEMIPDYLERIFKEKQEKK